MVQNSDSQTNKQKLKEEEKKYWKSMSKLVHESIHYVYCSAGVCWIKTCSRLQHGASGTDFLVYEIESTL